MPELRDRFFIFFSSLLTDTNGDRRKKKYGNNVKQLVCIQTKCWHYHCKRIGFYTLDEGTRKGMFQLFTIRNPSDLSDVHDYNFTRIYNIRSVYISHGTLNFNLIRFWVATNLLTGIFMTQNEVVICSQKCPYYFTDKLEPITIHKLYDRQKFYLLS